MNAIRVTVIIVAMSDTLFDRLLAAEADRWSLDRNTARNGKRRLTRNLGKVGLSLSDWEMWLSL